MNNLSTYAANALLAHIFKGAAFNQPAGLYVALSTVNPGEDGSGLAEPVGGSYARVSAGAFDAAASRASANTNNIVFPKATAGWGTISHWALFDASTAGNMLAYGTFKDSNGDPQTKVVNTGNTLKIFAGELAPSLSSGGLTTAIANKVLDHLLKNTAYTQPSNIYIAASTADPTDAGSGLAEPSGNGYARKLNNTWDAPSASHTQNTGAITFDTATGTWGTITHMAIMDASSAGNMLFYSTLGASQAIEIDDILEFEAGDIDVTLN